ncbi:RmlC-like cupin domain-containing protein [Pyrenochaeta sp. MPI-SDFR-AT-0127]|nr:RmlC-like cupin domain-containing protein [Pyrenochaeta sp. MPI-SDFR-AT-0127]
MVAFFERLLKQKAGSTFHKDLFSSAMDDSDTTSFRGLAVIPNEVYTTVAPRRVRKSFIAIEVEEGAGMLVRRAIGIGKLPNLSPFLMLDHFDTSFSGMDASVPDHPHRGQETISYIIQGGVDHEDFAGNRGSLEAGDLQFMTAGRGIMHSEMPRRGTAGEPNIGLQLWVDLPRELKYCEPRYRDLRSKEIPHAIRDNNRVHVKVISGQAFGVESHNELSYTPLWYLHFTVQPGGQFKQSLPQGWNAFCYVLEGDIVVSDSGNPHSACQFHMVVFEKEGDCVEISVTESAEKAASFIVVAGLPLEQPIVQYGPFVVNSREEVAQAILDFRTGQNGFERAIGWVSENSKSRRHSMAL